MDDLSLILLLCMFPPFFMMVPVMRGRVRTILLFSVIGIFIAFCAGHISGLLRAAFNYSSFDVTISVAPLVEETLKALPVVLYAFLFQPDRRKLSECAVMCGLGFALYENAWYFACNAENTLLFGLFRGLGAGMLHSLCTVFIAIGLSMFGTRQRWSVSGALALLAMSTLFHATYNVLVQSPVYFIGPIMTLAAYTIILLYVRKQERKKRRAARIAGRDGEKKET